MKQRKQKNKYKDSYNDKSVKIVQRDPNHLKRKVFQMECEVDAERSNTRAAERKTQSIGDKWAKEYNRLDEALRNATALIHELRTENVRLRVALTKREQ